LSWPKPFSYSLNDKIRTLVMRMMALVTSRSKEERLDFGKERIERILLVRPTFRLGDSILATPAIFLFRRNFPHARIDFVGAPIAKVLYRNTFPSITSSPSPNASLMRPGPIWRSLSRSGPLAMTSRWM
jgi:hypothetical protein